MRDTEETQVACTCNCSTNMKTRGEHIGNGNHGACSTESCYSFVTCTEITYVASFPGFRPKYDSPVTERPRAEIYIDGSCLSGRESMAL